MRKSEHQNGDMRPEYDFGSMKGIRGKHHDRYLKGTNVVLLEPDVAQAFPTERAVNEALRSILSTTRGARRMGGISEQASKRPGKSKRGPRS